MWVLVNTLNMNQVKVVIPPFPLYFIGVDMGCIVIGVIYVTRIVRNGDKGPFIFG